ncbi:DUF4258 domain-containing protein [Clostridium sp. CX1]|uniref:DUF4258 domain-containing protein n=1 Tax=Clostridium sp. CX1 TaxID=2978346 RepID=UPI0021C0BEFF|nr:DUF4258 domain-containing protein [Clostridium sp. CX1]MCT8975110.1 DUF4258 domain-containing protein [Clostridium sp. CX1]
MIDELAKLRSVMAEKNIRQKVSEGYYVVSTHAHNRMAERRIPEEKVIECITEGKSIEVQIGKEINDFKVLFQEGNKEKPEVYTVVADRERPVIVTVCRTKDEVWECVGNVLKRREMHKP